MTRERGGEGIHLLSIMTLCVRYSLLPPPPRYVREVSDFRILKARRGILTTVQQREARGVNALLQELLKMKLSCGKLQF
jgi:hypothetical protein